MDRREIVLAVVFVALLIAMLLPIIERAHAAFAIFEIMERGFR